MGDLFLLCYGNSKHAGACLLLNSKVVSLPWCFICLNMVCSLCSFGIGWKFLSHWYSGKTVIRKYGRVKAKCFRVWSTHYRESNSSAQKIEKIHNLNLCFKRKSMYLAVFSTLKRINAKTRERARRTLIKSCGCLALKNPADFLFTLLVSPRKRRKRHEKE